MVRPALWILSAASALMMSACVVAPYGHPARGEVMVDADDAEAEAGTPPPPPIVEVRPVIPFAGAVWIDGYWGWSAGRHVWVHGRWDHPRKGYRWEPRRWEPQGGHWRLRGGWRANN